MRAAIGRGRGGTGRRSKRGGLGLRLPAELRGRAEGPSLSTRSTKRIRHSPKLASANYPARTPQDSVGRAGRDGCPIVGPGRGWRRLGRGERGSGREGDKRWGKG